MLNRILYIVVLLALVAGVVFAQPSAPAGAASPSMVLEQQLSRVEKELVPMVGEMPDSKFNFAPTNGEFKGVRTFAEQAKHIAVVNYVIGGAILGEKPPVTGADAANAKTKQQIVKLLNDSFAYVHKAFGSVTAQNLTELIPSPFGSGQATRLGLAIALIGDQRDHYGQIVVYFRMNGMVPPASRR